MKRHWITAAACLAVGACAAPLPQQPAAGVSDNEPRDIAPVERAGNIEVAEIPEVRQVEYAPAEVKMVCSYEKRTGSNRASRVCRKQSDIDKEATAAKRTFEELHRSQREYPR